MTHSHERRNPTLRSGRTSMTRAGAVACVFVLSMAASGCGSNDPRGPDVGKVSQAATTDRPDVQDYVRTPGGILMHKSCVHEAPNGAATWRDDDGTIHIRPAGGSETHFPPCPHAMFKANGQELHAPSPTYPSWLEWSGTTAPSNGGRQWFNGIDGQWTVPHIPTGKHALLYYFNGLVDNLDPNNHTVIIQPVLQYGFGYFGGDYWTLAAWWVGAEAPGGAVYSTPITVNPGDTIWARTEASYGCATNGVCDWFITTGKGPGGTALDVTATTKVYRRAYQGVLETYDVQSCNDFPSDNIGFSQTYLYQPPPTGSPSNMVEMYNSVTWSTPVMNPDWPLAANDNPGAPTNCGYGGTNGTRGTTLTY